MTEQAAIAVYIHWPYCARICPYCDFNVVRDRGKRAEQAALAAAIAADLTSQAALAPDRRLVSIFFGGGTPSLMDPDAVADLIGLCRRLWPTDEPVEVSLEANPTDAEAGRFRAFAQAGVQRLSLGVQSLDDGALAFLGRNHDAAEARRAAKVAAAAFPRLSLDLIYALPGQTEAAWAEALRTAAAIGAEHISPYQLTLEPGTPFDRAMRRGRFAPADPDLAARLYETTGAVLEGLGFEAYEVSNHARDEAARSRHNLAYWRGEDYAACGPGAHGRLTLGVTRTAVEAAKGIGEYIEKVARTGLGWASRETLDPVASAEERLIMGLRTVEGVRLDELAALPLAKLPELEADGLLETREGRLIATPQGRLVLNWLTGRLAT